MFLILNHSILHLKQCLYVFYPSEESYVSTYGEEQKKLSQVVQNLWAGISHPDKSIQTDLDFILQS